MLFWIHEKNLVVVSINKSRGKLDISTTAKHACFLNSLPNWSPLIEVGFFFNPPYISIINVEGCVYGCLSITLKLLNGLAHR